MATPQEDYRPDPTRWSIQPDYTVADRAFYCSMTGLPKKRDEVVYQGAIIDFEGFFTIGQYSAEQLARLIGWVDPDEYDDHSDEVEALRLENATLVEQVESLQALHAHLREHGLLDGVEG
jgi:hypothetical protein